MKLLPTLSLVLFQIVLIKAEAYLPPKLTHAPSKPPTLIKGEAYLPPKLTHTESKPPKFIKGEAYLPPKLSHTPSKPPIPIIKMDSNTHPDGSYSYSYKTANGIEVEESGYVKNGGKKSHGIQTAKGSFSYTSPEGKEIQLTYIANENGFQPQGNHLPTPPPIPPEIQASLNKISSSGGHHHSSSYDDSGDGYYYKY